LVCLHQERHKNYCPANPKPAPVFKPLQISSFLAKWRVRDLLCEAFGEWNYNFMTKIVGMVGREKVVEHYEKTKRFLRENPPEITQRRTPGGWFFFGLKETGYNFNRY